MSAQDTNTADEVGYLLDVIRQLVKFSRAGTLHKEPGEDAAYLRAMRTLERHGKSMNDNRTEGTND